MKIVRHPNIVRLNEVYSMFLTVLYTYDAFLKNIACLMIRHLLAICKEALLIMCPFANCLVLFFIIGFGQSDKNLYYTGVCDWRRAF